MQKKTLTVKKVLIMGAITGLLVIVIAYFAIYMQQRKAFTASREGTFPKAKELASVQYYTTDNEGSHYYAPEQTRTYHGKTFRRGAGSSTPRMEKIPISSREGRKTCLLLALTGSSRGISSMS